ncbi:hypothetical protein [Corallococcus sp. 4LFB]|uniref:hypothetical protein n=1 Tax=Corallococcus sp. 4LFB TaxID=3383249 RepID=UPI003974BD29
MGTRAAPSIVSTRTVTGTCVPSAASSGSTSTVTRVDSAPASRGESGDASVDVGSRSTRSTVSRCAVDVRRRTSLLEDRPARPKRGAATASPGSRQSTVRASVTPARARTFAAMKLRAGRLMRGDDSSPLPRPRMFDLARRRGACTDV